MTLQNFRIGTRLAAAFVIVLVLLTIVASVGLHSLSTAHQSLVDITRGNDAEARLALEMRLSVDDRMIALRNIVLLKDATEIQRQVERVDAQAKKYAADQQQLDATFSSYGIQPDEKQMLSDIRKFDTAAAPLIDKVLQFGMANRNDEATAILLGDLRTAQFGWRKNLELLADSERRQNDEALAGSDAAYAQARSIMIGLSAAAVLCGLGLAWFITTGITRPINIAVTVAQAVAAGDLTSDITSTAKDETGVLLTALKEMNASLVRIVSEVRTGTERMTISASEIADGNMDLSSRTEDQASSLEETASSMEEMTATVRQNADNAVQGNQLAGLAKDAAGKGGAVIATVVATMEDINASSRKIAEIVSVIDGIAFQTNILALNAAVEAARAGEQGRGFAVVATEVRGLAHRSAAAAKEIKTMIDESVAKVDSGTLLVDQAGKTMAEVVVSVNRVTDIMSEITNASQEQSSGIEQINQAIMTMDNVTQQNAALVEESAAAAQSMQDQSVHLAQVVGKFILHPARHPDSPTGRARNPTTALALA